jgi:hypothetical protein
MDASRPCMSFFWFLSQEIHFLLFNIYMLTAYAWSRYISK